MSNTDNKQSTDDTKPRSGSLSGPSPCSVYKRPEITDEIKHRAACRVLEDMEQDTDYAYQIVEAYKWHSSGYELAKELEREYCWDITLEVIENLESMDYHVRVEHEEVCRQWVKENNIQPPFPIGSKITKGEITGISEHMPAYYEVKQFNDPRENCRLLVKFEDTEILPNVKHTREH